MKEDLPHILVVDDDERIRTLLMRFLSAQSMLVLTAKDAAQAREHLKVMTFDLIVLDIMMPGESGLNLTRYIKDSIDMPVLLLTARSDVNERIEGLHAGADDYLPKPFEPQELVLRINAILRRTRAPSSVNPASQHDQSTPQIGIWTYLPAQKIMTLITDSKDLPPSHTLEERVILTDNEVSLINALLRRPNTAIRRDILAQQIDMEGQDRAIDVQITRLRKKIEPDPKTPRYIQTIRGQGYLLRL